MGLYDLDRLKRILRRMTRDVCWMWKRAIMLSHENTRKRLLLDHRRGTERVSQNLLFPERFTPFLRDSFLSKRTNEYGLYI